MGLVELLEVLRKVKIQYIGTPRDLLEEATEKIHFAIFEASQDTVFDELKNMVRSFVEENKTKSSKELNDEICLTSLVEDICNNWEVDFENGPIDDNSHWIWSDVYRIVEEIGEELDNDKSTD